MDIAQYISDLLNEHDEVSLPGIGTFFKKSVNAYFNAAEGVYYPPSYAINFKAESGSSSTLIDHIIYSKNISESSAVYFVERFCENIKNEIDRTSRADVSPLGTLVKTENAFELQANPQNVQSDFYGLKPIKDIEWTSKGASASKPKQAAPPVFVDEEELEEPRSKGIWITLGVLLLLGSVVALAYFYYPEYFKNLRFPETKQKNKVVKPAIKPDTSKDSITFADSIVQELEKQGLPGSQVEKAPDTVSITSTAVPSADTVKTTAAPKPTKTYEIIVASFGLRREADNAARAFRRRGIDAKVIEDAKKPKFKISIGSFPTMSAAAKENKRIQKEVAKDSWILTVNNKEN